MKCLVSYRKRLKREFNGFSGFCEFFSYNAESKTCALNWCERYTAGNYSASSSNGGFITYWPVSRDWMDDEIVKFMGKPDEQGELREMDFA